jgi:DNA-binding XRE family transcriptional regulator
MNKYDGTNGIVITLFRKKLGLTQKELASKWGISRKTICSWENGRRRPSLDPAISFINIKMEEMLRGKVFI